MPEPAVPGEISAISAAVVKVLNVLRNESRVEGLKSNDSNE